MPVTCSGLVHLGLNQLSDDGLLFLISPVVLELLVQEMVSLSEHILDL